MRSSTQLPLEPELGEWGGWGKWGSQSLLLPNFLQPQSQNSPALASSTMKPAPAGQGSRGGGEEPPSRTQAEEGDVPTVTDELGEINETQKNPPISSSFPADSSDWQSPEPALAQVEGKALLSYPQREILTSSVALT